MNQRFTLLLTGLLLSLVAVAQEPIIVNDADLVAGGTYAWTADNEYVLNGLVYLEEGGTLTIEAGTVVRGRGTDDLTNGDNTSALIITRGATIMAEGTADDPIIFTAEDDDLSDDGDFDSQDRGEWGGIIILGNATIARPGGTDGIEGIASSEERAQYGGTDDEDNSGTLRYVSIRHGGAQLSTDNEINGLTLGGVGSGTTIEYVEVFANLDDGIEFFGGTVGVKYATVAFCGDDGMDYDDGWRGNGQFWFVIQEPGTGTGRAGEHDGARPDEQAPFSQPTIYNATYVGIGTDATGSGGDVLRDNPLAVLFRDNAGGYYYNSIFTGFNGAAVGIEDRDDSEVDSYARFQAGDLDFANNLFEGFAGIDSTEELFVVVSQKGEGLRLDETGVLAAAFNADNEIGTSGIAGISRDPDGGLDPRIDADGAALSGGVPNSEDEFFTVVSYRGAFGNRVNWLSDWTALAAYGYLGDLVEEVEVGDCIVITDNDLIANMTYTWTADNCYSLDGLVFLEAGGVLNIEAGVKVEGVPTNLITTGDNTSALIIARDAQIFADGTAEAPVVFTAAGDDLDDPGDFDETDSGQWGGLIILGNATIARPGGTDGIEGIVSTEERAQFGGTDDEDNSGRLNYVSIRHGGAQLSTDNEINGLTLGGVGSGTEIDYVEVFANADDGIEWFGGTVKVDHAVVSYSGDDGMDYDYGWRGGGQYWFVLQAPGTGTGRAGEHDGASPDEQAPFSEPTIYNATYLGIGEDGTATGGDANRALPLAVLFRDNAGGHYNNSIFTDFNGAAIAIEDLPGTEVDSYGRYQDGDLTVCNSIFFGFGAGEEPADIWLAVDADDVINTTSTAEVVAGLQACGNRIVDPMLNNIMDRDQNGPLDPRPYAFDTTATVGAPEAEEGFESVAYYGAFAPGAYSGSGQTWLNGWTALATTGLVSDQTNSLGTQRVNGFLLDAPAPNPARDLTKVSFQLPQAGQATLTVFDLNGRPLAVRTRHYGAGEQSELVNVAHLPNGNYLIVLDTPGGRLLQKMIVAR